MMRGSKGVLIPASIYLIRICAICRRRISKKQKIRGMSFQITWTIYTVVRAYIFIFFLLLFLVIIISIHYCSIVLLKKRVSYLHYFY